MFKPTESINVTVRVKNTGKVAGKEVVQLYVSKAESVVQRPEKELKAFKKVNIPVGQTAVVTFVIPAKNLAYFDARQNKWIIEPGKYKLLAGTSSRDLTQSCVVTML
jgi:beta-glucosidase